MTRFRRTNQKTTTRPKNLLKPQMNRKKSRLKTLKTKRKKSKTMSLKSSRKTTKALKRQSRFRRCRTSS